MKEELTSQQTVSYFGAQSTWGITKHMGGLSGTDFLVEKCQIDKNSQVLVIGSGSGVPSCHIAQKSGCTLTGIDIEERMIKWASDRAKKCGLIERVAFKTADVQALPFSDQSFDAVISESVLAFVPDKDLATREILRVLKPCGRLGINECVWHQPPPQYLLDFTRHSMGNVEFLSTSGWVELCEENGFKISFTESRYIKMWQQWRDEVQQLREGNEIKENWAAWKQFWGLLVKDKNFRAYAKQITPSFRVIGSLFRYLGYILIIGQKPEQGIYG
jgi:ubiquinone/menaquinone biosynthesis C-methylase UbiE